MDRYIEFYKFEDVWKEVIKHQPVGYLKSKKDETDVIKIVDIRRVKISPLNDIILCDVYTKPWNKRYSLFFLFDEYTFMDGTPFGKLITDEMRKKSLERLINNE